MSRRNTPERKILQEIFNLVEATRPEKINEPEKKDLAAFEDRIKGEINLKIASLVTIDPEKYTEVACEGMRERAANEIEKNLGKLHHQTKPSISAKSVSDDGRVSPMSSPDQSPTQITPEASSDSSSGRVSPITLEEDVDRVVPPILAEFRLDGPGSYGLKLILLGSQINEAIKPFLKDDMERAQLTDDIVVNHIFKLISEDASKRDSLTDKQLADSVSKWEAVIVALRRIYAESMLEALDELLASSLRREVFRRVEPVAHAIKSHTPEVGDDVVTITIQRVMYSFSHFNDTYFRCEDDLAKCRSEEQVDSLVLKKNKEQLAKQKYEKISEKDSTEKRHLAYLDWQKARVEYRIALYDIRSDNDSTDKTAREKKVIAENLRSHIDQMRLACDSKVKISDQTVGSLSNSKNNFPTSKNGELGAIRKDLLKTVFKKDRMNDLKYCKKPADTNKLFTALLNLRKAEYQFHLADTLENKLAKIKCDLEYRKAFYEIRCEDQDEFRRPKDKKAAAKLAAVNEMLVYYKAAEKAFTDNSAVIKATLTTAPDAKQGKLGKLRDELKTFRDTYQEKNLADKEAAFKKAKADYKNIPAEKSSEKLIAKLEMLQAELELKETLYQGRNNTSKTFYHGLFSKASIYMSSPNQKFKAAAELKQYVSDVLEKIQSQGKSEKLSIPEEMKKKFEDVPGQDTLNRIRREINAEVKNLIATPTPSSTPSP